MAHHLRFLAGSVALAAATILFLTPSAASAQDLARYTAIVDRYAAGDAEGAVTSLARWPRGDVSAAAKEWARRGPVDRLRRAVMLHTDLAYWLMNGGSVNTATFHLAVAQGMVQRLTPHDRDPSPAGVFARRWLAFVASLFTAYAQFDDADRIVRDGLSLFPRDPTLYVRRGLILESRVVFGRFNARGSGQGLGNVPRMQPTRALEAAAADYRRALDIDNTLGIAWLRLGWIHLLLGDARAIRDFDSGLEQASDNRTRYLAYLCRGRVAERDGRLDAARHDYMAALAIGGLYQTAYVAVSRVHEALGERDRAREVAQDYAALAEKADDPWWDFNNGGLDSESLVWLRVEARLP